MNKRIPEKIASKQPLSIIMRHAERNPFDTMNDALNVLLNENGKEASLRLGEELHHLSPITLLHSPVPRCRETAENIAIGIKNKNGIANLGGENHDLGGPYILGNWHDVISALERTGQEIFLRQWFNGELSDDLIMPLEEAAKIQLNAFTEKLNTETTTTIHITHDWNIMILREYYFHLSHEDYGIPDFLDSIYAYIDNDELFLVYKDHIISLSQS